VRLREFVCDIGFIGTLFGLLGIICGFFWTFWGLGDCFWDFWTPEGSKIPERTPKRTPKEPSLKSKKGG